MGGFLLAALLAQAAPEAPPDEGQARPAVPVWSAAEWADRDHTRWGVTIAGGVTAENGGVGGMGWFGVRRWFGPHLIGAELLSFQTLRGQVSTLGAITRFELGTVRTQDVVFPSFSFYVGAGPELLMPPGATAAVGARAVMGVHLPSLGTGILAALPRGASNQLDTLAFLVFLLPTALELQVHTGGAGVPGTITFAALIGF